MDEKNQGTPDVAAWDCSRDGHKMRDDGKWMSCSECGYTYRK